MQSVGGEGDFIAAVYVISLLLCFGLSEMDVQIKTENENKGYYRLSELHLENCDETGMHMHVCVAYLCL